MKKLLFISLLCAYSLTSASPDFANAEEMFVQRTAPEVLSFEELKTLSEDPFLNREIAHKAAKLLHTPLIDNTAYYSGAQPHTPYDPRIGDFIRVMSWNIEKSIYADKAIELLTSDSIDNMLDFEKAPLDSKENKIIQGQFEKLKNIDILILQEMEWGVKRSRYWNTAEKISHALNMNFAYAPQFLEVDPVRLGTEKLYYDDGSEDTEAGEFFKVDPTQYKGVFGSAVLSRYPIKKVDAFLLKNQPYDWYEEEEKNISFLEYARRVGSKAVFHNEMTREMKIGGRGFFRVDLHIPGIPNDTLTIINIHLEIKCRPKDRTKQMEEILTYIKDIKNPLIMMGDFNAAHEDISPTTLRRAIGRAVTNPTNLAKATVNVLVPQSLVINTTQTVSNFTKNLNDPFATDMKVVAPNPLKKMFKMIQNFRFSDGTVFDFRGDPERSINRNDALLSNSNQRWVKGFKTTFSVKRPIGIIGKYRLDWAFVKSGFLYSPEDRDASYQLAPHFGETLEELNTSLKQPISDHHPNIIDIPLNE